MILRTFRRHVLNVSVSNFNMREVIETTRERNEVAVDVTDCHKSIVQILRYSKYRLNANESFRMSRTS